MTHTTRCQLDFSSWRTPPQTFTCSKDQTISMGMVFFVCALVKLRCPGKHCRMICGAICWVDVGQRQSYLYLYGKTHVVQSLHHGRKHLHDCRALLGVSHCRLSFCVEHQVTLPQVVAPMGLPQNRCAEPSSLYRCESGTIRTYTQTSTDQPQTWTRTRTLDEFSGAIALSSPPAECTTGSSQTASLSRRTLLVCAWPQKFQRGRLWLPLRPVRVGQDRATVLFTFVIFLAM